MFRQKCVSCACRIILVTLLYAVAGKLALLLSVPGGIASAVWPGAGIALAAVLHCGPRMLIGVVLGSLLVTLDFSTLSNSTAFVHSLHLALWMSIGPVLQPVMGSLLIRKFVGFPDPLIRDDKIVRFLMLGGPVTALVSSTVGVLILRASGQIQAEAAAFCWFTWWVGDTIGILIFTPILLMFSSEPRTIWRSRLFSVGLPMIIAFAITVALFFATAKVEQATNFRNQERRSNALVRSFEVRLKSAIIVARSVASFFASSENVTGGEFHNYVKLLLQDQRGFQAISWSQFVRDEERDGFEQQWREKGYKDFKITEVKSNFDRTPAPAQRRENYMVVTMIEPVEGNTPAIGLDTSSRPTNRQTQIRAMETGLPALTGRVRLVQETGEQNGILIFYPVYRGPSETVEQRRENLFGFAVAVFRIEDLLNASVEGMDRSGITIQLYDESAEQPDFKPLLDVPDAGVAEDVITFDRTLKVADRRWTMRTTIDAHYQGVYQTMQAWTVLASGVVFTSLLGGFLMILTGRAAQVESVVNDRTKELSDTNQQLEIATRAKSEFLANMSHEIRTPMTAILGFVDLLAKDQLKDRSQKREAFTTIRRNGEHLLTIINDILDSSRIEAGKLDLEEIPIDPSALVHDVMLTFRTLAGQKRLEIFAVSSPDPVPVILGDPVRFRQIVMNLLSNAIKFTEVGQIVITLNWDESCQLTVDVADTGVGITPEQLTHIFRPFQQGDSATARKYGGAGLGLRISRRLSEMMHGNLTARPRTGGGAIFTLTLPNRTIAEMPIDDANVDDSPHQVSCLTGRHMLVIDDGPDNRLLISMLLRHAGAMTTTLSSGDEVLAMLIGQPATLETFDLILMDMQMPGTDGPDAAQKLRQAGITLPIIAISANVMDSDRKRCLESGFDDFLAKPINQQEMFAMCDRYLSSVAAG